MGKRCMPMEISVEEKVTEPKQDLEQPQEEEKQMVLENPCLLSS